MQMQSITNSYQSQPYNFNQLEAINYVIESPEGIKYKITVVNILCKAA